MSDCRKIAYMVLKRVLKDNAYSALALNSLIKSNNLDKRDSSFVSNIVYGVLENKLLLDDIVRQYSNIKLNKIDFDTLLLLEIGLYQIIYMDKVPDNASVNETVNLAKKIKLYKTSGFINAILRNFLRNDKKYKTSDELSIKYSVDDNIVKLLVDFYGREITEKILSSFFGRPKIYIRINNLKTNKKELITLLKNEGVVVSENNILENTLEIENTGSIEKLDTFKNGFFYIEDLSSQICAEILDCKSDDVLCDICSAPGGKSFYSAMKMNNKGTIYSYDLHKHKINLIDENAKRLSTDIITSFVRDATDNNIKLPGCNKLLCDVPCSGLGIMKRKPEIRYNKVTNIDLLPQLQYDILCINTKQCPINCDIVYSTCTLNPKENRDVVDRFLSEHKNYVPVNIDLFDKIERIIDEPSHMLTILPYKYMCDGFFISKFKKVSDD